MEELGINCPTKLANFLAEAWEMPLDYLEQIFMETPNFDQRNNVIYNQCFAMYMEEYHDMEDIFDLDFDELDEIFDEYQDQFYAESLKMKFYN
jgi:hypothetical protein